jgi:hypothetical protein
VGSNSAANAAQAAMTGESAAMQTAFGGSQSAAATLQPYTQSGLGNYNYLNYLLTGQGADTGGAYSAPATSGVGAIAGTPAGATPDQITQQIASLQAYLGGFHGDLATKYAGAYSQAEQQLTQLQSIQQQQAAAGTTSNAISTGGLPANYLTNIPQFSYNPNTDTGLQNASTFANGVLASQNAAAGNYGSGNMASSISNYLAGTLEPTYYNQAAQNYNTNQIQPRNMIYGYLTGNVGGSGQSANTTLANIQSGAATTAGGYAAQGGQSAAGGIAAQGTALSQGLTGANNGITTAGGQYLNYLNSQNIAQALQGLNVNAYNYQNPSGGYSDQLSGVGGFQSTWPGVN